MSILFLLPRWNVPSELFLRRMLEGLQDKISLIAVQEEASKEGWRGIPIRTLSGSNGTWFGRVTSHRGERRIRDQLRADRRLAKAIRLSNATQVLGHYMAFVARFEKVWDSIENPLFIHCHGYDVMWDMRGHYYPHLKMHRPTYPQTALQMSNRAHLIVPSRFVAKKLGEIGVQESQITIKPYGVPVPPVCPTRQHSGTPLTILYLGRLVDCKGPDLTIKAFDIATRMGLQARLIVAGEGPMRTECEKLIADCKFPDRISLVGVVNRLQGESLRLGSDIFTAHHCKGRFTGQVEAFGVSNLEAMASGLPVVTGRIGGVVEVVEDQETGILFEPGDVEEHAHGLLKLASDIEVRQRMGLKGWARAKNTFDQRRENLALLEILGYA